MTITKFIPLLGLLTIGCNKHMPLMATLASPKAAVQPGTANVPIVIVAGQSNAVGQGDFTGAADPQITWVGNNTPKGIGLYFAQAYIQKTGRPQVIVIQCAVGATTISQWAPGGLLEAQCEDLYNQVMQSTPTAKLATILFYQGESDTSLSGVSWASEFTGLVNHWRALYGNVPIEFVPLAGALPATLTAFPYWAQIQAQQASVSLPNVVMIKSDDQVSPYPDAVHLSGSNLMVIGQRLAQAYFGLLDI